MSTAPQGERLQGERLQGQCLHTAERFLDPPDWLIHRALELIA